ncbi:MAG TPA: type II toxin-antitoxin system VapC family toxin, partial [Actinomycetota bacterium]
SAIVHVLTARRIDEDLANRLEHETITAPHLLDVEVLQALRGLTLGHKISHERANHARALYRQLFIVRYPADGLAERIWSLRHNLTAYDAAYVALAEALDCPLVTRDAKLASAGHSANVHIYPRLSPANGDT